VRRSRTKTPESSFWVAANKPANFFDLCVFWVRQRRTKNTPASFWMASEDPSQRMMPEPSVKENAIVQKFTK
jgi:hypothetical protein